MSGMEFAEIPRREKNTEPLLESQEFVEFGDHSNMPFEKALNIALQIALQNFNGMVKRPKVCQITTNKSNKAIITLSRSLMIRQPLTDPECTQLSLEEIKEIYDIIIMDEYVLTILNGFSKHKYLTKSGFLLFVGSFQNSEEFGFGSIFRTETDLGYVCLLRPLHSLPNKTLSLRVSNSDFEWLEDLKIALEKTAYKNKLLIHSEDEEFSGIVGLMRCINTEELNIISIFVDDKNFNFDLNDNFFKAQLEKQLSINIVRYGKWGTFIHLPLELENKTIVSEAAVTIGTIGDLSTLSWVQLSRNIYK